MQRMITTMLSALKSYGPSGLKRILWEKEYSGDKWDFAQNSSDDCVYSHLAKHTAGGTILDLGCGSGNTANEIDDNVYRRYLGVDISENCLNKARARSKEAGRAHKNEFTSGDFIAFAPNEKFDVILFRESLYHVPMGKITSTLEHYARFLNPNGVFIVRIATSEKGVPKSRPTSMVDIIRRNFNVIEDSFYKISGGTVIVFKPKSQRESR